MPICTTDPDGVSYQRCVIQQKRQFPNVCVRGLLLLPLALESLLHVFSIEIFLLLCA